MTAFVTASARLCAASQFRMLTDWTLRDELITKIYAGFVTINTCFALSNSAEAPSCANAAFATLQWANLLPASLQLLDTAKKSWALSGAIPPVSSPLSISNFDEMTPLTAELACQSCTKST